MTASQEEKAMLHRLDQVLLDFARRDPDNGVSLLLCLVLVLGGWDAAQLRCSFAEMQLSRAEPGMAWCPAQNKAMACLVKDL